MKGVVTMSAFITIIICIIIILMLLICLIFLPTVITIIKMFYYEKVEGFVIDKEMKCIETSDAAGIL